MSILEENIKKKVDEYMNNNIQNINENIGGIFLYGFITGVIASYSGLLPYFAGISSGIILVKKYDYVASYVVENFVNIFQYIKATSLINNK